MLYPRAGLIISNLFSMFCFKNQRKLSNLKSKISNQIRYYALSYPQSTTTRETNANTIPIINIQALASQWFLLIKHPVIPMAHRPIVSILRTMANIKFYSNGLKEWTGLNSDLLKPQQM